MSTEVDIANLALAHLGDEATISSLDEGSAQSNHCQRFFAMARDALLEMHEWRFATRREALALLSNTEPTSYDFTYAYPNDALKVFAVLPPEAQNDTSAPTATTNVFLTPALPTAIYQPQDFDTEILSDGTQVIYTNQEDAVARFAVRVTDPAKWSPLFTLALSYMLASFLAGPVIKGDAGRKAAADMLKLANNYGSQATSADAQQKKTRPQQAVPWVQGR